MRRLSILSMALITALFGFATSGFAGEQALPPAQTNVKLLNTPIPTAPLGALLDPQPVRFAFEPVSKEILRGIRSIDASA